jgi:general L-amino acid transport system permease protein
MVAQQPAPPRPRGGSSIDGAGLLSVFVQTAALGVFILACFLIYRNTAANLARQGIVSGFDFMWRRSGFNITPHLVDFDPEASFARALLVGFLNTLLLSAIAIVASTILGFLIGLARVSPNWLARKLSLGYVETFRNIPLLLQIFFWYFGVLRTLPRPRESIELFGVAFLNNRGFNVPIPTGDGRLQLVGFGLLISLAIIGARHFCMRDGRRRRWLDVAILVVLPLAVALVSGFRVTWDVPHISGFNFVGGPALSPELVAIAIALSLYQTSFIAEAVRGGVLSVPRGQIEAARSLGLAERSILRLIVLPQALRAILPPLITLHLSTLKNSSLGAAIGYPELVSVFAGTTLSLVGQAVEIMSLTLMIYLLMGLIVSGVLNIVDWRLRARGGHVSG